MAEARPFRWLHPALLLALVVFVSASVRGSTSQLAVQPLNARLAATVTWPPSQGLLVSEVVTGATSASDEFIEIYNAGAAPAELGGLEIVYVTATGSTITRKQTWTSLTLSPARHLLLANSSGKWAASADGLYSGGLAGTGGSLVLRIVGGAVIDSLTWGDAASSFVEGAAGPAPPAGSSLERKPGGQAGNSIDTNDNLADTRLEPNPVAQSLASPAVPVPTPTPTATASPTATPSPSTPPTPPPTLTPSPTDSAAATEPCTPEPTATVEATTPATVAPTDTPPPPTLAATASSSPTDTPSPSETPTPTPAPTDSPAPVPTPATSPMPIDTATDSPMPSATRTATASATPGATVTPTPETTPYPGLAAVRQRALGTRVDVRGRLTARAGLLGGGTLTFVEDTTGGIALGLDSADWPSLGAGTDVAAEGTLVSRNGLLVVVLDTAADISLTGSGPLPDPLTVATGLACEPFEARLIAVEGWIAGAPASLEGGGFAAVIDDGTGPLSVVVTSSTGVGVEEIPLGSRLRLAGVLSQYDPYAVGAGYQLLLRSIDDVVLISPPPTPLPTPTPTPIATPTASPPTASPSPTPSRSPTPSPSPTASPSPTPSPSPSPTASPSPTPSPIWISAARSRSIGSVVRVRGVVTVGPGWILGDSTIAIEDASAGIFVRLPDASVGGIVPGRVVEVEGALGAPYGNLELRPGSTDVRVLEMSSQPSPPTLALAELGDETEGLIARVSVTIHSIESSTSGSLTLLVEDSSGEGRIFMHAPLGLTHDDFTVGERIAVVGLVGDRLGLFRLWPRNQSDIAIVPSDPTPTPTSHATPTPTVHPTPTAHTTPTPTPTARPTPTPTAHATPTPTATSGSGTVIGIADALRRQGQSVTIEGTVTTRPGLLDSDGVRVAVQDSTAAILVRLPSDSPIQLGQRVRISGQVGTYYGAPQLTAATATRAGDGALSPTSVRSAPIGVGLEWRLVTVTGLITSVHRDGDSWRAEISLSGGSVPIVGLARSGIGSTALVPDRTATVTGIVRRAYPTASDQRFAIVPRTAADIHLGNTPGNGTGAPSHSPGPGHPTAHPTSTPTRSPTRSGGPWVTPAGSVSGSAPGSPAAWVDKAVVALSDLAAHESETVAVGGVVEQIDGARVVINDGTATATIRFVGDAVPMIGLFTEGDLLNALGTVERVASGGIEVAVSDAANIVRLAPIGVSPTEIASPGYQTTPPSDPDQQVSTSGSGSTTTTMAILLGLAMVIAAITILGVPSVRKAVRERVVRASEELKRRIVQLRSG